MLHRRDFRAMGSTMLALVDSEVEPPNLANVPAWFDEWEQILSRFRSDSELSQLNIGAGVPHVVSEVLWDVCASAVEAAETTGGLVTPLILGALDSAGYDRSFDLIEHTQETHGGSNLLAALPFAPATGSLGGLEALELDPSARSIRMRPGCRLDFGGIAKGWAAEQAAQRLLPYGPSLVSAGGDIAITGPRADGGPWEIGVEDPFNEGLFVESVFVSAGGVATSGKDRRRWIRGGVPQHHIIDPRTGLPAATDVLTATVIAPSAMQAEAMAKAVLISGSQAGLDWLDQSERLAGLLVLDNGQRLYSRNIQSYL